MNGYHKNIQVSIQFHCPHCDLPLTVAKQFSGAKSNCLKCGEVITIPGSIPLPKSISSEAMLSRPHYDYRSVAIWYRCQKVFFLTLLVAFPVLFLLVGILGNDFLETTMLIIFFGLPFCLLGLLFLGYKLWWKKRMLQKGGYSVGFLGTDIRQFDVICPQCNFSFFVSDCLSTTPTTCTLCEAMIIPAEHSAARVSTKVFHSEQWKYDYRAIVKWDRRMTLSLLLSLIGVATFIGIITFLFSFYSAHGVQSNFFHRAFMLSASFFLLVGVLSAIAFLVSAAKLFGLLRLRLPIIYIVVMGVSVIGILLYILILPFLIKLRAMFVLREEGYTCSLWRDGMKQFSGQNTA